MDNSIRLNLYNQGELLMLGILFTAAPSTDVVKDLQDKVISLQDHEVAFLNTTISNMLIPEANLRVC